MTDHQYQNDHPDQDDHPDHDDDQTPQALSPSNASLIAVTDSKLAVENPLPDNYSSTPHVEIRPFIKVTEETSDVDTTTADLNILNNHLEVCHAALPRIKTVMGLCALSAAVTKLIEVRRKVKKLPYGESNINTKRTFQVLE